MRQAIHAKSDSGLTVIKNVNQLLTSVSNCSACLMQYQMLCFIPF